MISDYGIAIYCYLIVGLLMALRINMLGWVAAALEKSGACADNKADEALGRAVSTLVISGASTVVWPGIIVYHVICALTGAHAVSDNKKEEK